METKVFFSLVNRNHDDSVWLTDVIFAMEGGTVHSLKHALGPASSAGREIRHSDCPC